MNDRAGKNYAKISGLFKNSWNVRNAYQQEMTLQRSREATDALQNMHIAQISEFQPGELF